MSPIKRAFHYFTRKTTHSAIMVLILTAISILIFTVLSTTVTANHYIQQIKNSFSKNITLSSYRSTDVLTPENILKIANMADIVNYKCLSNTLSASLLDSAKKPFDIYTNNDTLVSEGFEHAGTIRSNTSSEQDELFVDGTFELVKGRHLNKNDKGKALIHRNLAESNGLSVGDIIKLDFPKEIITDLSRDYDTASMNLKPIKVEIVGIFQTAQSVDESSRLQLSHLLYENNCYIDRNTYASFFGLNGNTFFHKVTFTISNSAELTNVVSTIQNLKWLDWSTCNIWSDMNEYGPTIDALSSLNDLLQIGLLLILLVCLLILILIISYGVKRRKKEIAFIFQNFNLIDYLTAEENLNLVSTLDALPILEKVGINKKLAKQNVLKLSGGQQQRVAVARALISDASILLADEPTGNLDEANTSAITNLLIHHAHHLEDKCVIIVTHSMDVASQADVVLSLEDGVLKQISS